MNAAAVKKRIANWGNYPVVEAEVARLETEERLAGLLSRPMIARGMGRCYGDASLGERVLSTLPHDRFLSFDEGTGDLECQAGTVLGTIVETFVPRGWFLPVTPGTRFVTVGGAISADVHGKNHHIDGSFCRHVRSLRVMTADGGIVNCSQNENAELFDTVCGGMGLAGIILSAVIRLKKVETPYVRQETVKAKDLGEVMDLFERSADWPYSVAWIDCLSGSGRALMIRGAHATREEALGLPVSGAKTPSLNVPFFLPSFALNGVSVKLFNALYYAKARRGVTTAITGYESFFYPLDGVQNWNRIYGRRGFVQYQLVLPKEQSRAGIAAVLKRVADAGQGSFLAVLKLLGKGEHLLSFPMEGYTLALDFPITKNLFGLLDELDAIVLRHGGRLYLAKDARMNAGTFNKGYANADAFRARKAKFDPRGVFQSLQSKRLHI